MPNINRTDDVSQQQEIIPISLSMLGQSNIVTGTTIFSGSIVPRAMVIQSAQMTCFGISGAPQALLGCLRFANATSFVIGTTGLIPAYGTSGYLPYSLGAVGATTLNLQKGDMLVMQQLGGSGAATTTVVMNIVVKNIQDIKTWF